jgi:hypothetical protein
MKKEKTSNLVARIIQIAVSGEEHKIRSVLGKCPDSSCLRASVCEREEKRREEIDAFALRLL